MRRLTWTLSALLLPLAAQAASVKMVTLTPRAQQQVDESFVNVAAELIVDALGRSKGLHALGTADVMPFLDEMGQTQLEACDDDTACLIEIGGALGVDYVVAPGIGVLGDNWLITLRFLVPADGTVAQRSTATLPRSEESLLKNLCPYVQGALRELSAKDARVRGDPSVCDGYAPASAEGSLPAPPLPDDEVFGRLPPATFEDRLTFGLRAGVGGHTGILGAGVEARYGRYSFNLGTGTYSLTAAATANVTTFTVGGLRLSPYGSLHFAWTAANGLFGIQQHPGAAAGATVGVELLPLRWLSVRGGVGFAYNPQTWGTSGHPPLAWDGTVGVLF